MNFSLHNASFVRRIFPELPKSIQKRLIEQVLGELNSSQKPSHRMLAIYRTLRAMQPDLPPVEGTDPSLEKPNSDFSKLLKQSHEALSRLTENLGSLTSKEAAELLETDWSGMSKADINEFVLLSTDPASLTSELLLETKGFRSKRGFGYVTAASRTGNIGILEALLAIGASPNEVSDGGHTPLHAATLYSKHDCARALLLHNADTEALLSSPISSYYTPLTFAASTGDSKMTELLLENGANPWHRIMDSLQNTSAHVAASGAFPTNTVCLKLLLEKDPRLASAKNSHQRTPLHHAAGSGNVDGVKTLLEAGAEPNCRDMNGASPLHTAWFTALDFVAICVEYAPEKLRDPGAKIYLNRSALISSMKHLRPLEVIDILLGAGADSKLLTHEKDDAKSNAFLLMLASYPWD